MIQSALVPLVASLLAPLPAATFGAALSPAAPQESVSALARSGASRVVIGAPGGLSVEEALSRREVIAALADSARRAGLSSELALRDGTADPPVFGVDRVVEPSPAAVVTCGSAAALRLGIPLLDAPEVARQLREKGPGAVLVVEGPPDDPFVALDLDLLARLVSDPKADGARVLEGLDRALTGAAARALFGARADVEAALALAPDGRVPVPASLPRDPAALLEEEADRSARRAVALARAADETPEPYRAGLMRAASVAACAEAAAVVERLARRGRRGGDPRSAFAAVRRAAAAAARLEGRGGADRVTAELLRRLGEGLARSAWPDGCVVVEAEDLAGPWRHQTNIGGYTGAAFRCANLRGRAAEEPLRGVARAERAGLYRVLARAYEGDGNDRSFSVAVNGVRFPPTHRGLDARRYSWQLAGSVDLPAGDATIEVRDAGEGWESVDAILLAPDVDFEPVDALDATAAFSSEKEREEVFTALYDRLTPRRPLAAYRDAEAWRARRDEVRRRAARALGLDPLPERVPLDVRVAARLDRDGYTVERIWWQVFPGVHASGWLYRPEGEAEPGSRPAILNPHGHFAGGARSPVVQSRLIGFAKLGYVALAVDSTHVHDLASGLSPVGLMTWDNIRGIDLLESLPEVDRSRIGCTGASGGGQQTMYLMALDDRIRAAVPAVMITWFEKILSRGDGAHCFCNHVPGLVAATDETELVAAFAPRPVLFLCNTTDWTKSFPWDEFPEIAHVYALEGAPLGARFIQYVKEHDYDREMREAAYAFFERTLKGRDPRGDRLPEPDVRPEDPAALERISAPPRGVVDQRGAVAVYRARAERSRRAIASDAERRERLARVLGHEEHESRLVVKGPAPGPALLEEGWRSALVETEPSVRIPVLFVAPRRPGAPVTIVAHPDGKLGALVALAGEIDARVSRGEGIVCADVRLRGELRRDWTWNLVIWGRPEAGMAATDLLALARWARAEWPGSEPTFDARGDLALAALFAAALDPSAARAAVDAGPEPIADRPATLAPGILAVAEIEDLVRLAGPAFASPR